MYLIKHIKKILVRHPIVIFQRKKFFFHKKCSKAPVRNGVIYSFLIIYIQKVNKITKITKITLGITSKPSKK